MEPCFPLEMLTFWSPILRPTLGALSACPPCRLPLGISFPVQILTFWPLILRPTLSIFSAVPRCRPHFSFRNPCILATHTKPHSKLIFCSAARLRSVRGLEFMHFPLEILAFWPPILSLTLSSFSAIPRHSRRRWRLGNPCIFQWKSMHSGHPY